MVHNNVDVANMQGKLVRLPGWRNEKGMKFSAFKSNVFAFGCKSDKHLTNCHLNGKLLTSVQSVMYLGCLPL